MAMWKLIVWTRVRAEVDAVADLLADPSEVAAACPRWLRWEISDPERLRLARQHGGGGVHATRLRLPNRIVAWPLEVVSTDGGLRFTERVHGGLFSQFVHRHRVERAIGGYVRFVDEVVLEIDQRPARVWAWGASHVLARVHQGLVARLGQEAETSRRVYRLGAGNRAHAEAALNDLPGG